MKVTTSACGHRARVRAAGDEPGDVGHVEHEQRAHLVGDLAERLGVDHPRVRRRAGDDEPRPLGLRAVAHLVEVDPLPGAGPSASRGVTP